MKMKHTGSASALLLAVHACALAQTTDEPVAQVVVTSSASDKRAQSTTMAIVVGRDELDRQGDTSLAEVLKRQPGIALGGSPGKEPAIRMQGLGSGYVAILLDGLPAPGGFSLESISPDMVERIEIRRAATAETSSQAVAGTINVILRRAGAAANDIKVGSAFVVGRAAPQLIASYNGRMGTLAYTLAATLKRQENPVMAAITEQGMQPALLRYTASFEHQVEDTLELAPRLAWQPTAQDSITAQSYLRQRRIGNARVGREITDIGAPSTYAHAAQTYDTDPASAYADVAWTRKLAGGARFTSKLSGFYIRRTADFVYRGMDAQDNLLATHLVASGPIERESTFSGSWRQPLWGSHYLVAGWEWGRKQRTEYRRERRFDAAGTVFLNSDESYRAQVARSAFFLQDEWNIDAAWSAYAGLRREDLQTTGAGNAAAAVDVGAGAWSPMFQLLYKPQPRDQFRLAVGRTYKAPNIVQLMPRRYAVDNANSATNPDQQGNPALRPELSLNIDVAWERTIGKNDMVSVSAFHKRIHDVTLPRLFESGGIWTSMPANQGNATVRGIVFEGKAARGALALRGNLARNWSRVDSVPGPDNHIEGQAPWSGNFGVDVAAGSSIDMGGTATWRTRAASRSSVQLFSEEGARRQLDLYGVWKRDRTARVRVSVSNLLHRDEREGLVYENGDRQERVTVFRTSAVWRVVWEQTL